MIERIKDLEYKLVTRESRPEDRERIAQLEKEVAEKEYLCKRIMEEMKYFKVLSCSSFSIVHSPIHALVIHLRRQNAWQALTHLYVVLPKDGATAPRYADGGRRRKEGERGQELAVILACTIDTRYSIGDGP